MSSFDEWFDNSPSKSGVLSEQSERSPMFLATRYYMQEAYNAGMERAADIVQAEYGPNYVKGDVAAGIIHKEIAQDE